MYDLSDVWGTSDLSKVFGGGPDDRDDIPCSKAGFMPGLQSWLADLEAEAVTHPEEVEDFNRVKAGSMTGEELAGLCF